jgi:hypothetical protein
VARPLSRAPRAHGAGLVLGCVFFTGVPAVVVGMGAKRAVADGQASNPGFATAGIALPFAFASGGTGG